MALASPHAASLEALRELAGEEPLQREGGNPVLQQAMRLLMEYRSGELRRERAKLLRRDAVLGADGFLATGDVGVMDERGLIRIVDRVKDMINVSGFKVWPAEVENALYKHPDILEVAVYGVPHPEKGEAVRAEVVQVLATRRHELLPIL